MSSWTTEEREKHRKERGKREIEAMGYCMYRELAVSQTLLFGTGGDIIVMSNSDIEQ